MPIYEYRCKNCENVFEEWTRHIDDNTTQSCPSCGGEAGRIVSNTSFVLKGGGWYVTDYGYRKGVKDESSSGGHGKSSGASASSSDSSSSAKPLSDSAAAPAAKAEAPVKAAPAPASGAA
ncbi:zinc ribbon domain-containing protein [Desulfovibrio sp. OttesenSCG-928-C14]|nr:zinc ribbon domain-containing protein [Desulfovibrio sp. OttesenSCG-928-C14]